MFPCRVGSAAALRVIKHMQPGNYSQPCPPETLVEIKAKLGKDGSFLWKVER